MNRTPILWAVAVQFLLFSVMAVGGINAVVPEMQRQIVGVHQWMSSREFSELFAVAQAAPGPNLIVSTVLGWRIAGIWGAVVATVCVTLPSAVIVYTVSRVWDRFSDRPWRQVVQDGIAPMVIGLIGSSGYLLAKGAASDWKGAVLSAAAAVLTWKTRLNPLWILAGAAGLALAGVV